MEFSSCKQRVVVCKILDALSTLKNKEKSPSKVTFSTNIILQQAIITGNVEEFKSVVCSSGKAVMNLSDPAGLPLLMRALQEDQIDCFTLMVEEGADLSVTDEYGWTVLHLAAAMNHLEAIKLILKHKPELLEARTSTGLRPIGVCEDCQLTGFLLQAELKWLKNKNNANKKQKNRKSACNPVVSSKAEELELLKLVMATPSGDDSNKIQEEMTLLRQSVLHLAAARNYLGVAYYIVDNNLSNVDAQDSDSWSAIHFAAMYTSVDVLMLLLKYGASRDLKTNSEQLPSDLTSQQNVLALLEKN